MPPGLPEPILAASCVAMLVVAACLSAAGLRRAALSACAAVVMLAAMLAATPARAASIGCARAEEEVRTAAAVRRSIGLRLADAVADNDARVTAFERRRYIAMRAQLVRKQIRMRACMGKSAKYVAKAQPATP